jgi:hypothetical protein
MRSPEHDCVRLELVLVAIVLASQPSSCGLGCALA